MTSPSQTSLQAAGPAASGSDLCITFIGVVNHFDFVTHPDLQFTHCGNSQLHLTFPFNMDPTIRDFYPGLFTGNTFTSIICSFFSPNNPYGSQFLPLHNWFQVEGKYLPLALAYDLPDQPEPVAVTLCLLRDRALQS